MKMSRSYYDFSDYYDRLDRNDDGRISIPEIQKRYKAIYDLHKGQHGFVLTPEEHGAEISRRYDINGNKALTFGEAKEWAFCLAPFLDHPPPVSDPAENKSAIVPEKPVPKPENPVTATEPRGPVPVPTLPDGPDDVGDELTFDEANESELCMASQSDPELDDPEHIEPGTSKPEDPCDPDDEKIIPVPVEQIPIEQVAVEQESIKVPVEEETVELPVEPVQEPWKRGPDEIANPTLSSSSSSSSASSSSSSSSDSDFEPVKEKSEEPEMSTFVYLGDRNDQPSRCCSTCTLL